ncbi:MAG TPA: hypothetical protein DCE41_37715 [Cytophagales bacterium]|nr:hypothetical protein [Cytophagales bacterium]
MEYSSKSIQFLVQDALKVKGWPMTPRNLHLLAEEVMQHYGDPFLFKNYYIYKKMYSEWDRKGSLNLRDKNVDAIAGFLGYLNFADFQASLEEVPVEKPKEEKQITSVEEAESTTSKDADPKVVQNNVFGENIKIDTNNGIINL